MLIQELRLILALVATQCNQSPALRKPGVSLATQVTSMGTRARYSTVSPRRGKQYIQSELAVLQDVSVALTVMLSER
jgi:hypothetical protein